MVGGNILSDGDSPCVRMHIRHSRQQSHTIYYHSLNFLHKSAMSAVFLFAKCQGRHLITADVQVDGVLQERC